MELCVNCLDACLNAEITNGDQSRPLPPLENCPLPLPVKFIPKHVYTLAACAAHQIQLLSMLSDNNSNNNNKISEHNSSDWEDALDDGFFLCDLRTVYQKLHVWRTRLFPTVKPFFALKCHPDPNIAALLRYTNGAAGFDCASVAEIQLALGRDTGIQASSQPSSSSVTTQAALAQNVIYANPQRAEQALATSLRMGVRVLTFDGAEELHKVHRLYQAYLQDQKEMCQDDDDDSDGSIQNVPPQMILRILVPDEHSTVPLGEKFGAPPETWPSLIHLARTLDLPIVGVSFHCGSGNHDPASYCQAIRLAKEALDMIQQQQQQQKQQHDIHDEQIINKEKSRHPSSPQLSKSWLLDIGGGYPGYDGVGGDDLRFSYRTQHFKPDETVLQSDCIHDESTAPIAATVTPLLEELFPNASIGNPHTVHFVAEPGRYFVEAAFALCSRIYKVAVDLTSADHQQQQQQQQQQQHYHYYIPHGVQGVFKDILLCGEIFTPEPLQLVSHTERNDETFLSTVHGPSGADYDLVCRNIQLPRLETGDWLLFDRMGAYTLSIASRSGRPPVRYVM